MGGRGLAWLVEYGGGVLFLVAAVLITGGLSRKGAF
jgi:hypothetical protein